MTSATRPSHSDVMAATELHHESQRRRAAQTVRAHIRTVEEQESVLDCLGLLDLTEPHRQA
jgi:hypothetical protein